LREEDLSTALLNWYSRHAREMPWRVGPCARQAGTRPNPYHVWLSEVMLQQTTVAAVRGYFQRFIARWPTISDLAAANDADVLGEWAGLGYYARARNLMKCARMIASQPGGEFPTGRDELLKLPGIGPYTAAAIAAIAFDRPATVVDGNVERVMARLHAIETPLPNAKPKLAALATHLTPQDRAGDYAQAVMDLGATICTPRNPNCGLCPWRAECRARAKGLQTDLPRRTPKKPKPTRYGIVYLVRRDDGAWLLERRPDQGLLGGMLGWPGSDWGENPQESPPLKATWSTPNAEVRHTFTHFHLRLSLRVAAVGHTVVPATGEFVAARKFRASELPTVMRKAYNLACETCATIESGARWP